MKVSIYRGRPPPLLAGRLPPVDPPPDGREIEPPLEGRGVVTAGRESPLLPDDLPEPKRLLPLSRGEVPMLGCVPPELGCVDPPVLRELPPRRAGCTSGVFGRK